MKEKDSNKHVDISAGLSSLQFETALTSEESKLLPLRARAHCLTTGALCGAVYFVTVLNLTRKEVFIIRNKTRAAERIMQVGMDGDPAKIGIIGCGRLGRQLLKALKVCCNVSYECVFVSTRRPESLSEFSKAGVNVDFNNAWVASNCDVIFLCCLPSTINQICTEIKNHLTLGKAVYSFVAGMPAKKLATSLNFTNIIKPDFAWTSYSTRLYWDVSRLPVDCLGNKQLMEKFCPLYQSDRDSEEEGDALMLPVSSDLSWLMRVLFACINYATTQEILSDLAVEIGNKVFFQSPKSGVLKEVLLEEYFQLPSENAATAQLTEGTEESDRTTTYLEQTNISMHQSTVAAVFFPYWDLTSVDSGNYLAEVLTMNKNLRKALVRRFAACFDKILQL